MSSTNDPWPPVVLRNSRIELVKLIGILDELDSGSVTDELIAYTARFLVVRSCGYVEFALAEALSIHAERRAHPFIASYVRSGLTSRGSNPRPTVVADTLRRLSPVWATEFEQLTANNDDLYGRELSFMVDRRNKIAHGQSEGVGRRKALDLASVALEIGDWLVAKLDPR